MQSLSLPSLLFGEGRDIHEHVVRTRCETNVFVGAAIVDMYAKCGYVASGREVLGRILGREVVL